MSGFTRLRGALTTGVFIAGAAVAMAQDAPPPPAAEAPSAAAPAPAAQTPPAPSPQSTPATAAPDAAPKVDAEEALPEVEVIQKEEPKPVKKTAPPPKPKPQPITTAPPASEPEPQPAPVEAAAPESVGPPPSDKPVRMSPLGGSEIPLEKVPGAVGNASASDIARDGTGQVQNALNQQVPGIVLSDTAGSSFRTDIQYRGFDASPIGGRSQALAVYMNGVRINESFGDTVNLDLIPAIAINDITVLGNNPVYGLNAIGGAIGITMKDGFSFEGATIDAMGGSFDRRQIAIEAGGNANNAAAYVALEKLEENGFRDFSEAEIRRFYGDLAFRGSAVEVHLSFTGANSSAGVVTAAPVDLLDLGWGRTFTSPQVTDLEVMMPTLSATVQATDTLSFSGLAYYRKFKSNVLDGNLAEPSPCSFDASILCLTELEDDANGDGVADVDESEVLDENGNPVSSAIADPLGSIERINTEAESYGGSVQAVSKAQVFGRPNQFLIGTSYDHGKVKYKTSSELGEIGERFVVTGSGIVVEEPEDLEPRSLVTENDYWGIYFSNTLDITDAFALTIGGRYNHATIKMTDLTGNFDELNTTNKYERFNPMVGATYKLFDGLSVYGGYSEANRAPTAAELGCAEPENPCLIESFLTDDPPLKQVVSRSVEVGLRGEVKSHDSQRFNWSLGYFRTLNEDDILNAAAEQTGRGYFLNAGDTLRQGVELALGYQNRTFNVYGSYAFIDATFQDDIILPAPNTPVGTGECPNVLDVPAGFEEAECNFVREGDHLPGIPQHRIKAGFEYWLTSKWKLGSDLVYASDQFFFGDEANNNRKLAGYTRVDLHTSYDVTNNIQIYGLVKNLFDKRYGLYGTFFDPEEANEAAEGAGLGGDFFEDPRSVTPAQPFAVYGGLKVQF